MHSLEHSSSMYILKRRDFIFLFYNLLQIPTYLKYRGTVICDHSSSILTVHIYNCGAL